MSTERVDSLPRVIVTLLSTQLARSARLPSGYCHDSYGVITLALHCYGIWTLLVYYRKC